MFFREGSDEGRSIRELHGEVHCEERVTASLADKCDVQIAYAIGVSKPVSVMVYTYGTGKVSDERITDAVKAVFDMTPKGIIERLNLRRPIYRKTATYGHFGRDDPDFTWERTDKVDELKKHA